MTMLFNTYSNNALHQEPKIQCPFCEYSQPTPGQTMVSHNIYCLKNFVRTTKCVHVKMHLQNENVPPHIERHCRTHDNSFICLFKDCLIASPHVRFNSYKELTTHILNHCHNALAFYNQCVMSPSSPYDCSVPIPLYLVASYSTLLHCWFSHSWIRTIYERIHNTVPEDYRQLPYYNPDKHPCKEMFLFDYDHSDWSTQFDMLDQYIDNEKYKLQQHQVVRPDLRQKMLSLLTIASPPQDTYEESSSSSSYAEIDSIGENIYIAKRKNGSFKYIDKTPDVLVHPTYHVIV